VPPAVSLTEVAPQPTIVIPLVTTWAEYPSQWGPLLDEVWEAIHARDIRAGRNIMLYRDDRPSVEVGAELLDPFTPTGRVIVSALPTGPALTTTEPGSPTPQSIAAAHQRIHDHAQANGQRLTGVRWETYSHHREHADQMHLHVSYGVQASP
jgi:hypothetical protein